MFKNNALAAVALGLLGSFGSPIRVGSYRAPTIPTNHAANVEAAERRRTEKNARRAAAHAKGLANYHPITQAARAATVPAKPKRVRKPAAAKVA